MRENVALVEELVIGRKNFQAPTPEKKNNSQLIEEKLITNKVRATLG